jgi:hypothetical protein
VSVRVDYDDRAIAQAAAFLDDPPGIAPNRGDLKGVSRMAEQSTDARICRIEDVLFPHTYALA